MMALSPFGETSAIRVSGLFFSRLYLWAFLSFALLTVCGYVMEWGRGSPTMASIVVVVFCHFLTVTLRLLVFYTLLYFNLTKITFF